MSAFDDEYDNNPHDERLDRSLAAQGASLGNVQELNSRGDRPKTEQEVMDAIFYPNGYPKFKTDSIADGTLGDLRTTSLDNRDIDAVTGDLNQISQVPVRAAFATSKQETPSDGMAGIGLGETTGASALTAVKGTRTKKLPKRALMPSTLKDLATSYAGSPNNNSTRTTPAIESSEHIAEQDSPFSFDQSVYKLNAMMSHMAKECTDAINTPLPVLDDDGSLAVETLDTPDSLSKSTQEDLNTSVWAESPVQLMSAEKPAAMTDVDWLKKLDGVAAPDYDGEWEDSPSRVTQKKLLEERAIAEPGFPFVPAVASNSRVVVLTPKVSDENLADKLEEIDLKSPVKKAVKKPTQKTTKEPSVSAIANEEEINGLTVNTPGKDSTNIRQHLAPKASNFHSLYTQKTSNIKFELQTPVGVSPMPTFTQIKDKAVNDLKRGYVHDLDSPKSPVDSDKNLIDGEYADVATDMLDYEMGNAGSKDYPTYRFPGTYDAAKHDTLEAAKNVSSAAYTFGSALGVAGVGRAVWSVGALVGRGARRTGKVVATTATMGAIKLGYKEQMPASIAQWAEETSYNEALKAEKKKPVYKLAGVRYKKGDPRKYVLNKDPSAVQGKSIEFEEDLDDDDDWTAVNVTEGAEEWLQQAGDYQDEPRGSYYESIMTTVENTATVTVNTANRVGRNVSRAVRTLRAQPHDYFEQRKIAENWPQNLKELEVRNKVERRQSIPRHLDPDFEKVRDPRTRKPLYKRPAVSDPDDVEDDFDGMVLPGEE